MYTKEDVERILRINGIDKDASDEDIKSVLLYAKCENLDDAVAAIRGEVSADQDICGLQQPGAKCNVLLADERLKPETIKDLLGIDVKLEYSDIEDARRARQHVSLGQIFGIIGWSLLLAIFGTFGVMWYYQIGIFHQVM